MRPPFFAFYPAVFAGDVNVEAMSTLQVGAYMLLLCKAWQGDPPASLPNDDLILSRLARVDAEVWREIKAGVLFPFRVGADGRLHNKRLRLEYDKALKAMRARKKGGERGAGTRWGGKAATPDKVDDSPIGSPIGSVIADPITQSGRLEIGDWRLKKEEKTPLPPAEPGGGGVGYVEFVDINQWPEFVREWDAAGLPGAGKIQRTHTRVGLLQQRLAVDDWRARWREAVRRAGRSSKCRGCDPTWAAGLRLDTFLKDPDMLVRILEGEFDDKATAPPADKKAAERRAIIEAAKRKAG